MTSGEKAKARDFMRALEQAGWHPVSVDDGFSQMKAETVGAVINIASEIDDCVVVMRSADTGKRSWFRIVNGNARNGSEVIADYGCADHCADAFDAAFDRVFP